MSSPNANPTTCAPGEAMVAMALAKYLPAISEKKFDPAYLSTYRVEKPWGYEVWLELNEHYCLKIIHMKEGSRSSLQSHQFKYESNIVISGSAMVYLKDDENEDFLRCNAMDGWTVRPGQIHRVTAVTDYTAIEVSTPHLDDVVRHADDAGRINGAIESEHQNGKV